jgi:hypothetical protein
MCWQLLCSQNSRCNKHCISFLYWQIIHELLDASTACSKIPPFWQTTINSVCCCWCLFCCQCSGSESGENGCCAGFSSVTLLIIWIYTLSFEFHGYGLCPSFSQRSPPQCTTLQCIRIYIYLIFWLAERCPAWGHEHSTVSSFKMLNMKHISFCAFLVQEVGIASWRWTPCTRTDTSHWFSCVSSQHEVTCLSQSDKNQDVTDADYTSPVDWHFRL